MKMVFFDKSMKIFANYPVQSTFRINNKHQFYPFERDQDVVTCIYLQYHSPEEFWQYRAGVLPESTLNGLNTERIIHYKLEDYPVETKQLLNTYQLKLTAVNKNMTRNDPSENRCSAKT